MFFCFYPVLFNGYCKQVLNNGSLENFSGKGVL